MNSFEDILPKLCVVLAYIALFMFFVFCSIENVTQILKQRKQHSSIRFTNFLSAAINNYLFLAYGCNQRHVFFDSKTNQRENFKILNLKKLICPPSMASMFSSGLLWTYGFNNTQTTGNRSNTIKFVVCCGEEETRSEDYGNLKWRNKDDSLTSLRCPSGEKEES